MDGKKLRHSFITKNSKKFKILLVEDCKDLQVLSKAFLSTRNIHVEVANNGVEAITKVLIAHYDIIFMDLQMPVMGGFEAFQNLKHQCYTGPIVAMTASPEERKKALKMGFRDFISKPFSQKELFEIVDKYYG